jgi:flagellar biosynthesis/type III secretory pathway M-ring protein FliF/YscJ
MNTKGNEMRRFIISTTTALLIFTILIIAGFAVFSIIRINREEEQSKQNVIDQFLSFFEETANASRDLQMNPTIQQTMAGTEMMTEASKMNFLPVVKFVASVLRSTYNSEFYVFMVDGKPVAVETKQGVTIADYPATMPEQGYQILDELGGQKGTYIAVYHDTAFPGLGSNQFSYFVVDRTAEIKALSDIYAKERTNMIWVVVVSGMVAIAAAVLLSTLILRFFTRRYITRPIEELVSISHEIMEGEYKGDVVVTESSDFADLQRLLRSGQIVLDKAAEMVSGMAEQKPDE